MRTKELKYDLPQGWSIATLKDLVSGKDSFFKDGDWIESRDQNPSGEVRLIQLADIGDGEFKDKSNRYMTLRQAKELNCTFLEKGDILVARMPEPLGRACIFPIEGKEKFVTVVDVAIIRTGIGGVDNRLLMTFLNTPQFREKIKALQSGSTRKRISRNNLGSIEFPLPPVLEQSRIASKVDSLFSELDNAVHHLNRCQKQLGIYRQALLKQAFEGKLTEEWRKENNPKPAEKLLSRIAKQRDKFYERELDSWKHAMHKWEVTPDRKRKPIKPSAPQSYPKVNLHKFDYLFDIPSSSAWIRLGELTLKTEYGSSSKSQKTGKIPVLRMGNIQDGKIDWGDLVYTSSEEEITKYTLSKNDVLFNRTNSPEWVGKTAIYKGEQPAIFAGYLIRVNQIPSICNPDFLNYYLNSHAAKSHAAKVKTDAVNQSNINGEKLRNYPFPLFPIEEQEVIVELLDSHFSLIESLEKSISEAFVKSEYLRKSISKMTFEGKLVEQNPNDEHATELLKRIAAEKTKYLTKQKMQKSKRTKKTETSQRMDKNLTIKEILQSSKKPIPAREVWQQSKYKDDIEAFYAALKKLQGQVEEVDKGILSLVDEG